MNFDKLPIWQKEAILIAEVLCGFYGYKPTSKYAPKVEAKISKLAASIGSIESMKKDVSILKKVLPEITKLRSPLLTARSLFMREGQIVLKGSTELLQALKKPGRKTLTGNFEYWFLAVIAEANRNPKLTESLLGFIENKGAFHSWSEWRYGKNIDLPFYFPKVNRDGFARTGDFKARIKENTLKTLSKSKDKKSIDETVKTYRKIHFRRDTADELELGVYSYLDAFEKS